jgi:hypothetical protein
MDNPTRRSLQTTTTSGQGLVGATLIKQVQIHTAFEFQSLIAGLVLASSRAVNTAKVFTKE